ncbi:MAG: M14 family metallopeptidase [Planctomycetota bacterium]
MQSLFAKLFIAIALTAAPAISAPQQNESFDLFPGGTYDPTVAPPARLLGFPLGSNYTEHHRLIELVRAYTQNNERAVLEKYGETEEKRPLYLAYISSPENLKNLPAIRADLQKLVDVRGTSPEQIQQILARIPVIVWLSFNVHGNEPSSSEAAIGVLYQLIAGTDARTEAIRKDAIVVIDPCSNPDGRERYVRWFNGIVGTTPDPTPSSWEHREPWPGGRVNHYYFDLNRDWAFLTQIESKRRVVAYLQTPPQVHVDLHEMGASSSYFFFPPVFPVNTNLPGDVVEWGKVFGKGNAAAFDIFKWQYYTGENFDLFYPGFGDSWPTFQGAIGMTYEQAGHSSAGLTIKREDDQILTLRDRAWHHFIASIATCETAVGNRASLMKRFYDWHRTAIEEGENGPIREYIIPEGNDPPRAAALASLLISQGIQVFRAGAGFVAGPLRDFDGKDVDREAFPAGTYLIPLAQPRKRLANALLEPSAQMRDLYFYDVSAWSLPRAFGVLAYQSKDSIRVARAPYDGAIPRGKGVEGDAKNAYAFLVDWKQGNAASFVASILHDGLRVSMATKEFKMAGKTWQRGTAVVPAPADPLQMDKLKLRAEESGISVIAVASGLSDEGVDLGSDSVRALTKRRVALLVGDNISANSFGAVRFLLEKSYRIPFSIVPISTIGRIKLSDFGAIVIPDGFGFDESIPKDVIPKIREWMLAGGNVVAFGGAAFWATAERSGLTRIKLSKPADAPKADTTKTEATKEPQAARYVPADQREADHRKSGNPGSILKLALDPASSVVYGCGEGPLYVLATNENGFDPESGQVAAYYANNAKVAGFLGSDAARRLSGAAFAITEKTGRGRAVLFSEDPNFRLVWQGLTKAFLNAILLP